MLNFSKIVDKLLLPTIDFFPFYTDLRVSKILGYMINTFVLLVHLYIVIYNSEYQVSRQAILTSMK